MKRYKGKAARWQQQDKENERMNKTEFIKVKDDAWVLITQSLSYLAREAFKRFFNPKYRIEERAIKLLNLMENDRKM